MAVHLGPFYAKSGRDGAGFLKKVEKKIKKEEKIFVFIIDKVGVVCYNQIRHRLV